MSGGGHRPAARRARSSPEDVEEVEDGEDDGHVARGEQRGEVRHRVVEVAREAVLDEQRREVEHVQQELLVTLTARHVARQRPAAAPRPRGAARPAQHAVKHVQHIRPVVQLTLTQQKTARCGRRTRRTRHTHSYGQRARRLLGSTITTHTILIHAICTEVTAEGHIHCRFLKLIKGYMQSPNYCCRKLCLCLTGDQRKQIGWFQQTTKHLNMIINQIYHILYCFASTKI